jgi:hypothetical protein
MRRFILFGTVLLAFLALGFSAHAQTRTWVSGVGDDANPCSRTLPCKTFAGALPKTADGGEIDCLDPGGFGTVIISQSITIDCSGTFAGVLASATANGITISDLGTGPLNVVLRGLAINGAGTPPGTFGISDLASGTLLIEQVRVFGFPGPGIGLQTLSGNVKVEIKDSTIHNNAGGGVLVQPFGGATANVSLTRTGLHFNLFGVRAQDGSKVTAFQASATNNTNNGFLAVSAGVAAEINLINSVAANTGLNGVATSGALATIRLVNTALIDNGTGINTAAGGTVVTTSPASNVNAGNATPGAPNGTTTLQ